jgi:hypothetical protein
MIHPGGKAAAWYARLLSFLPPAFRSEFGAEMVEVFAQQVRDAGSQGRWAVVRTFIGELAAYPGLWLLAYRRGRRVLRMSDLRSQPTVDRPAPWGAVLAAVLPLAGYPLLVLMAKALHRLSQGTVLDGLFRVLWTSVIKAGPIPLLFYALLLGGLLVAWRKGFPRWSFPYLGWLVVVVLFGVAVVRANAPPWWLNWGPLVVTILLAALIGRSLAPVRALWRSLLRDWTQASLALLSLLEIFVLASFDEMPGPRGARLFWQSASSAALVGGVVWYMRCTRRGGRIAALLGGAATSVVLRVASTSYYWHNYPKSYYHRPPPDGYKMLFQGTAFLAVAIACLLIPWLISALIGRLLLGRSVS